MNTNLEPRKACPACGSLNVELFSNGLLSPWVSELFGEPLTARVKILECSSCQTVFSEFGYSPNVMTALYSSYRGKHYQEVRQRWESGYTKALNNTLNSGDEWFSNRQRNVLQALIQSGISVDNIESCVDFGGGHGGVMPNFKRRYVYEENSQVSSNSSIEVLQSWDQVKMIAPDMLMCCGVLEHVSSPTQLIELLQTSNAEFYYFEVPAGKPAKRNNFIFATRIVNFLVKSPVLWRTVNRIERQKISKPFISFFPMRISEHLQFFSTTGLIQLLDASNLEVLFTSDQDHNKGLADSKNLSFERTIGVVARRR